MAIPSNTISDAAKVALLSLWQPVLVLGVSASLGAQWLHHFPAALGAIIQTSLFGLVAAIPLTYGLFLIHRIRPEVAYLFALLFIPLSTAIFIASAVIGVLGIVIVAVVLPTPVWITLREIRRRSG